MCGTLCTMNTHIPQVRLAVHCGAILIGSMTMLKTPAAPAQSYLPDMAEDARQVVPSSVEAQRAIAAVSPEQLRAHLETLVGFGTRHTLSETESDTRGIGAARRWLKTAFERAVEASGREGELTPKIYLDRHMVKADGRRIFHDVEVVNVVCEIPGVMPKANNRCYYDMAHYDSRISDVNNATDDAPGADDNGSGTVALLELARVISRERLDATVVLIATAGEEQGLYGATAHANAMLGENVDTNDRRDIRAVLNNDIIGDPRGTASRYDPDRVRVFSEGLPRKHDETTLVNIMRLAGENDSPSRQLARYIAQVAAVERTSVQPRLMYRADRFLRGGDHTPFNQLGVAAVRFTQVNEVYDRQHQDVREENGVHYGDTPEYVDEHYLADVARLNAASLIHLANAPSTPTNARIIVADLATDTTLRWEASPEPDVAGYEIVWRETSSPVWEHAIDVGNTTEATIDLSKDNWFFGVRAYDTDGYRSPVAFPYAARE